jgi:hypothetical protein
MEEGIFRRIARTLPGTPSQERAAAIAQLFDYKRDEDIQRFRSTTEMFQKDQAAILQRNADKVFELIRNSVEAQQTRQASVDEQLESFEEQASNQLDLSAAIPELSDFWNKAEDLLSQSGRRRWTYGVALSAALDGQESLSKLAKQREANWMPTFWRYEVGGIFEW